MPSVFAQTLARINPRPTAGRRWLYVPYDQLSDELGPLSREDPGTLGIVMLESPWKAELRPYHQQKLALVLANGRHFALEQARRGVAVRHEVAWGPMREALAPLVDELGPLTVMEPAERELRADLRPLVEAGALRVEPHEGWLTQADEFDPKGKGPPWRMDTFYRRVRKRTGLLMTNDGRYEGGKLSFDADNRRPWRGDPPAPEAPRFEPDPITREVGALVRDRFGHHPGRVDLGALPATYEDAQRLWQWARQACLPCFGPFEDAMSRHARGLFHTRVSPLLNLHRLRPAALVQQVAEDKALPLSSREGFVRQILGWREFVRHVHRATDGFRRGAPPPEVAPGDAGYEGWAGEPWPQSDPSGVADGGAAPDALGAKALLPAAFWGRPSGLRCLDTVVESVWDEGYSHHITRLMVLCNIAALLDISPRALTDWFWVAYIDAYDWVVEPNVLAMGTIGTGPVMTTKPYVCGAGYLARMSDYCEDCAFDPRRNCPLTPMYWAYLARHRAALTGNPRLSLPLASLSKRPADRREADARIFAHVAERLARGQSVDPAELVAAEAGLRTR
ncbi:MAG: cryptochrome/photolyase family protein [Myxococcota bacterium]